ncbi:unnamed protein product [Cylicocyclus nassatus]|uniref:Uncharacterized protein n=1 Tax=Cylicocyclus nassatus TaxID=53992 RepID=A0AA36GS23_CYLNA|nr:unnamed protein product [Cylicocyclus nassatus]
MPGYHGASFIVMFLFGRIGVTYALFVCAAAIKCYKGIKERPPIDVRDCPLAKYCAKNNLSETRYDCDDLFFCRGEGCVPWLKTSSICCCNSDLCNGGVASEPKQLSGFLSMISIIIVKLIMY